LTICGIACAVVFSLSMMDFMHTEKYRKVKGIMYGSLGIFTALPTIHLVTNSFSVGPENDYLPFTNSVPYYASMGLGYLGGLVIYVFRCPERYRPGKYDVCGHSH